jgi:hypothetical protein
MDCRWILLGRVYCVGYCTVTRMILNVSRLNMHDVLLLSGRCIALIFVTSSRVIHTSFAVTARARSVLNNLVEVPLKNAPTGSSSKSKPLPA